MAHAGLCCLCVYGVQRLEFSDDRCRPRHSFSFVVAVSSSYIVNIISSSIFSLVVLGLLVMQLFSCQDLSHRLECCNYFLVETSRSSLGVGSILGSRPLAVVRAVELFGWRPLAAVRVLELFLGRDLSREVDARTYAFIVLLCPRLPHRASLFLSGP